jgi:undecaprenyl-diphosphatase
MGIIQGVAEFLPVSSSAHLALYPKIFNVNSDLLNSVSFDVALHAGTLVALVIFFWKKILDLLGAFFRGLVSKEARKSADFKMGLYIIAATIPAAIVGYKWGDRLEEIFRQPLKMATVLIVFGLILWLADRAGKKSREMGSMNLLDSLIIGAAQAVALIPGVSRSGVTITAGMFLGYKREDAAEFSFILSIPAVAGAFVMQLKHLMHTATGDGAGLAAAGFVAAVLSGVIALKFLLDFVKNKSFAPFVIYRCILGAGIILLFIGR